MDRARVSDPKSRPLVSQAGLAAHGIAQHHDPRHLHGPHRRRHDDKLEAGPFLQITRTNGRAHVSRRPAQPGRQRQMVCASARPVAGTGHLRQCAQRPDLFDGEAFGKPATRVDGSAGVGLQFPSGANEKASDFESWFYLLPIVLIASAVIQGREDRQEKTVTSVTVQVDGKQQRDGSNNHEPGERRGDRSAGRHHAQLRAVDGDHGEFSSPAPESAPSS